ncbi:SANT and BTB domain regulator of class switch recombination [Eurosta solidaginis]|uniref:SANT and BTB domain regulator of class switch recombination n=1 Tax=Eurosta solidaginis TaxID=178769 RepID=UPI0035315591
MERDISTNRKNYITYDDANPVKKIMSAKGDKKESEVVIHVCDEIKNITRDFHCPQKLLVDKMGYFAEITAGQKLDEMDISVHCDIQIFDWLIKWMKQTDSAELSRCRKPLFKDAENVPHLDSNNVIPILVSAEFLQMEPLMIDCLSFCHARLCEVIHCSSNLSCLNDPIIKRLSAMFTNLELEMVRDKKERLTPRLWIKLIQSLCDPEPEALRGHFYSLAGLFRCSKCGEYLTNTIKSYIACQPYNYRLSRWGQLSSSHVRDSLWDMNNFIVQIFKEHRSWRRVYWKLWGHCHFLYCCICEMHFPVYKMAWCRFHPMSPNYLESTKEDFISGPIGRYPCCGRKAFRFETFPETNGCHLRDHSIIPETDRERQILQIIQFITDDCMFIEPSPEYVEVITIQPFWISLALAPQELKEGLLPNISEEEMKSKIIRKYQAESSFIDDSGSESSSSNSIQKGDGLNKKIIGYGEEDFSSDSSESEHGEIEELHPSKLKKKQTRSSGRYWCGDRSARSNQDHQREFEEKTIKHILQQLNKQKEQSLLPNSSLGGFYVRLESEWKYQLKHRSSSININNSSSQGKPKQK